VVANIGNERTLRELVAHRLGPKLRIEQIGGNEIAISADGQLAAVFLNHYLLLGSPQDLRRCLNSRSQKTALITSPASLNAVTKYVDLADKADVVTYTNDAERVRSFFLGWAAFRGVQSDISKPEAMQVVEGLPYAVTETTLEEFGFERRTRSCLGQFSGVLSLLTPAKATDK
jgi:hypothetical protein